MPRVKVALKHNAYRVTIGRDAGSDLRKEVRSIVGPARLFVIADATFHALHGKAVRKQLGLPVSRIIEIVVPSGEKSKSMTTVEKLHSFLIANEISRDDVVLAAGGGVTTDLVGFVAATTLRGLRWIALPTTLLGMVDAAIGGKTGVNHKAGKNLIGAFWQPSHVHCDLTWLHTLPRRELIAGMGEIVKYAGLEGAAYQKKVDALLDTGNLLTDRKLQPVIAGAISYKAGIVARDEREGNIRMWLNLGHTFAHGIEKSLGYGRLLHGEAVLIGLWAACELSLTAIKSNRTELLAWRSIIEQFLRSIPYRKIDPAAMWQAMRQDKKRAGRKMRFVLLSRPGSPLIHDSVDPRLAKKALTAALTCYAAIGGSDAAHSGR